MLEDYSKHQQKIIKRYYQNHDAIQLQKLSEMVADLYLAEGRKREKLWKSVGELMKKLEVPQSRIDHLVSKADPALIARLVTELQNEKPVSNKQDGSKPKS